LAALASGELNISSLSFLYNSLSPIKEPMITLPTADLADQHPDHVALCTAPLKSFGKKRAFFGQIVTINTHEDGSLLRTCLQQDGKGKVLVVDGQASLRVAILGDKMAQLGIDHGWEGVIINGAIRDSATLGGMDLGVLALGANPLRGNFDGKGDQGVDVSFGNVMFREGGFVYCDDDGVLFSAKGLILNSD
jgi:regulator of ribonuclease activity A